MFNYAMADAALLGQLALLARRGYPGPGDESRTEWEDGAFKGAICHGGALGTTEDLRSDEAHNRRRPTLEHFRRRSGAPDRPAVPPRQRRPSAPAAPPALLLPPPPPRPRELPPRT